MPYPRPEFVLLHATEKDIPWLIDARRRVAHYLKDVLQSEQWQTPWTPESLAKLVDERSLFISWGFYRDKESESVKPVRVGGFSLQDYAMFARNRSKEAIDPVWPDKRQDAAYFGHLVVDHGVDAMLNNATFRLGRVHLDFATWMAGKMGKSVLRFHTAGAVDGLNRFYFESACEPVRQFGETNGAIVCFERPTGYFARPSSRLVLVRDEGFASAVRDGRLNLSNFEQGTIDLARNLAGDNPRKWTSFHSGLGVKWEELGWCFRSPISQPFVSLALRDEKLMIRPLTHPPRFMDEEDYRKLVVTAIQLFRTACPPRDAGAPFSSPIEGDGDALLRSSAQKVLDAEARSFEGRRKELVDELFGFLNPAFWKELVLPEADSFRRLVLTAMSFENESETRHLFGEWEYYPLKYKGFHDWTFMDLNIPQLHDKFPELLEDRASLFTGRSKFSVEL